MDPDERGSRDVVGWEVKELKEVRLPEVHSKLEVASYLGTRWNTSALKSTPYPPHQAVQRLDLSPHAPADRVDSSDEASARPPTRFTDFQARWPSLWFRVHHQCEWGIDMLLVAALAAIYGVPRPEFGVQRVVSDWSAVLWIALFGRLIHNLLHFFLSLALMPAQSTRNPNPVALNPSTCTLLPKLSALYHEPSTLIPQP